MKEPIEKYRVYITAGLIGAIIHRIRNSMAFKQFIGLLFISSFMGLSVGIVLNTYYEITKEISFVVCSLAGTFSQYILDEFKEIISYLSIWVKEALKIKTDHDDDK